MDDLVIVPIGIAAVVWLIPPSIMAEHRQLATAALDRPISWWAAVMIVVIWTVAGGSTLWLVSSYL